jgi:hypothetical protein
VYDSILWHRIDLGGAANRMQIDSVPSVPAHTPPPDPYAWPDGSDSGLTAADRALSGGANGAQRSSSTSPNGSAAPNAVASSAVPDGADSAEPDTRPVSVITLDVSHKDVLRGSALEVSGTVRADSLPCSFNRVDISIEGADKKLYPLGALPALEGGRFSGKLTVPTSVPVGDYRIVATSPGGGACGKSL